MGHTLVRLAYLPLRLVPAFIVVAVVGCQGDALLVLPETESPLQAQADDIPPRRVLVAAQPGRNGEVKALVRAAGGIFHHEFDDLGVVATTLPAAAIAGLQHNPNIEYVEDDVRRYPSAQSVPYGIDKIQARDVWDANRDGIIDIGAATGAGRTICIIDSGIYTSHEDFTGVPVSGYAGDLPWNEDGCGHGTHVAGTIAAVNNDLGVVGVSPGAVSLYIVRVFGNTCGWAYSSDLVNAAEQCRLAGANVISMSLGGSSSSTTENNKFAALDFDGVLSVAAAGNDGSTRINYPAGYPTVVSVAAVDASSQLASFSQRNSDVEIAAPGVAVRSSVPWDASVTVDGVKHMGTAIELAATSAGVTGTLANGGLCTSSSAEWAGQVVLCERGTNGFNEKVQNVQASGGSAAVIYNNVPGSFTGTLGTGNSSTIPVIGINQDDGQALVANKLGVSGTVINQKPGSGYEAWDGTSMATPHVSSAAALAWSQTPSATNRQVRSALQSTALDLGTAGRDSSFGYGLVQAKAALDKIVALSSGDTTAPVIANVASARIKGTKFKITWTTDELSDSEVKMGGGVYTNASRVKTHSMSFSGSRGVTYTYSVSSTDTAGNRSIAGPFVHNN